MSATLRLTHERVDDVPLLLGFLIKLQLPEIIDRQYPPHPLHQGLSNGWLITVDPSRQSGGGCAIFRWVRPGAGAA